MCMIRACGAAGGRDKRIVVECRVARSRYPYAHDVFHIISLALTVIVRVSHIIIKLFIIFVTMRGAY